jgi:cell division protein FtsW
MQQESFYQNTRPAGEIRKWWRSIDQQLIIAILILLGFSLMLVATTGPCVANRIGLNEHYFAIRQLGYLFAATIVIITFSTFDKKTIKILALLGFFASVILLALVKLYGYEVKGAVRWINIFGISIQPSEFVKPFFAVVAGWLLSLKFEDEFPSFTICMVFYAITAALIITQPDLGMLIMISVVLALQFFIAGLPIIWVFLSFITGIIGITSAYMYFPHVAQRINNFLDPENSENYQVTKSMLAITKGSFFGQGPGEGLVKQSLPDSHTDFIFAAAAEEFGAIACLGIIAVFAFIVLKSLLKLIKTEDKFIQIAASGIVAQFGFQSLINIGVTLNLLPTKGMTLPFISYGGSSTLAIAIGIGMLLALTKETTAVNKYRIEEINI